MSAELGEPTSNVLLTLDGPFVACLDSQQFPKRVLISDLPALVGTAVIVGLSVTKSKARVKDAY
jgi:hypothetical protein